ncbi:MAG: hypothetical protein AB8G05_18835 [Oligoflexales bacterium]
MQESPTYFMIDLLAWGSMLNRIIYFCLLYIGISSAAYCEDSPIEIYSRRVKKSETSIEQNNFFTIQNSNFEWYFLNPRRERYVTISKYEASRTAAKMGYQSREFSEKVYQARKNILDKIGHVMPGLNFDLNDVSSLSGAVGNIVGFLVPSNWFNLAAAKRFYKSERYALIDFLIVQHFETEHIYLNIHMMIRNYFIRKHFKQKIDAFITKLELDFQENMDTMNPGDRFKFKDGFEQLKIFSGSFFSKDYLIEKQIVEILENFSYLLSFDINLRVRIESIDVPYLGDKDQVGIDDFKDEILAKSYLLKSLKQLEKSVIQSRRAGFSGFLTAGHRNKYSLGVSLGVNNIAQVKISSSKIEEVRIARLEAENRISRAINNLVSNQNIAIELAKSLYGHKLEYEMLFEKHLQAYKDTGRYDPQSFRRGIKWGINIEEKINLASHIYMISKAELNKFRIGPSYRYIENLVPVMREQLKEDKKKRKSQRKLEKLRIKPYVLGK